MSHSTFRVICNGEPTLAAGVVCLLVGESLQVRVDFGEPGDVALAASSPVIAHRAPDGASVAVDGTTATGFTKPGAYLLKVTFITGQYRWLDVFVFEPRCLDLVSPNVGGRSSPLSTAERRRVLRGLAHDAAQRRDGTFAALTTDPLVSLEPYGSGR